MFLLRLSIDESILLCVTNAQERQFAISLLHEDLSAGA